MFRQVPQAERVRPYFKSFNSTVFLFYFPLNLSTLTRFRVKGHNSRCLIYKGFYNYSALLIYSVIVNNKTKFLDISRSFGKESNPY